MPKPLPSPEMLRKLLRYDPETGKLFWRERFPESFSDGGHGGKIAACRAWNTRYSGKEALGYIQSNGYKAGGIGGKKIKAHRAVWAVIYEEWPLADIDHINGDGTDNRESNLRDVSKRTNMMNKKMMSNNQSGIQGVYWHKAARKWAAFIGVNGKVEYLGIFTSKKDAVRARQDAEKKYGYHPNHGRS